MAAVTVSARVHSYYSVFPQRLSETPEIARSHETQAPLTSRGRPKAELEDRKLSERSARLPWYEMQTKK